MPPTPESGPGDEPLVRYLLGLLPDEDAERLDELSIADDEIAWRLRAAENDLVDAYVRGTLAPDTLQRFESFYLSSPRRREKVRFARSLLQAADASAAPASTRAQHDPMLAPATPSADTSPSGGSWWYDRIIPHSKSGWSLAAAAALLLLACGTLLFQDARLRHELTEAQRARVALDDRARELEQQLADQRAARAEAARELERVRVSLAEGQRSSAGGVPGDAVPAHSTNALTTLALVLFPQTRAPGSIPTLVMPPGADRVAVRLHLESNDFSRYQAALKDPATNQIVWRSPIVAATSDAEGRTVSITVPASVLKPQHFALELSGRGAAGRAEIVGSYAFRIVRPSP